MSEEKLKGIPLIFAPYFGPDCGPIFWPGLRPYILAPNAALYCGPECGPILTLRFKGGPYILAPNAALYCGPECGPLFNKKKTALMLHTHTRPHFN
jgi:hypothetical protein